MFEKTRQRVCEVLSAEWIDQRLASIERQLDRDVADAPLDKFERDGYPHPSKVLCRHWKWTYTNRRIGAEAVLMYLARGDDDLARQLCQTLARQIAEMPPMITSDPPELKADAITLYQTQIEEGIAFAAIAGDWDAAETIARVAVDAVVPEEHYGFARAPYMCAILLGTSRTRELFERLPKGTTRDYRPTRKDVAQGLVDNDTDVFFDGVRLSISIHRTKWNKDYEAELRQPRYARGTMEMCRVGLVSLWGVNLWAASHLCIAAQRGLDVPEKYNTIWTPIRLAGG